MSRKCSVLQVVMIQELLNHRARRSMIILLELLETLVSRSGCHAPVEIGSFPEICNSDAQRHESYPV